MKNSIKLMRRRNANKQTSTQIINIDEKEEHVDIDLSDFQKKLPNYSKIQTSRQSVLPNLSSLLQSSSISGSNPVDEINDANNINGSGIMDSYFNMLVYGRFTTWNKRICNTLISSI